MAEGGVQCDVDCKAAFDAVKNPPPTPVMRVHLRPEGRKEIENNLAELQRRIPNSRVETDQKGTSYLSVGTGENTKPLASLSKDNVLTLYETPRQIGERVKGVPTTIVENRIIGFMDDYKVASTTPVAHQQVALRAGG